MNISWKRVWILIKKWRLFIISSAIAVLSLIFVIKTYGKTNESCKLINDIAVSFFSGALFADVTFFVEIRIATQKEWQQFANVISKYIFELDKKIFELEKENILTEDRNRIRELEHINECIGEMIDEIRQYNMIYFLKAYQMEVFLGKLLCVIERYLEIIKKEEKIEQKKEDVKINKTRHRQNIYVKAIGMIKQVNTMLDTFEGIGLKMYFDDDKTPVGKVMNVMLQNPKDIACEALGVELREEKGYNVGINDDHLLDLAGQDAECAKNIWDCFVNEKEEAREMLKNKYNATGFGEVDEK